jgi:arsenite oxidase small subunit
MRLSRRSLLKILLSISATFTAAAFLLLAEFFNPPFKFEPRKMKIDGAGNMLRNSSLIFQWPTDTRPFDNNLLIRDSVGNYCSFNRVCTHLQCYVNYDQGSETMVCPCHGTIYDSKTGEVISGPARKALPKIDLEVDENGDVYAVDAEGTFGDGRG